MRLKQGCRGAWIVPLVLAADRITKVLAMTLEQPRPLMPGVINMRYVQNTGIAFSMFSGSGIGLILVTFGLIAALLVWLFARPDEPKLFRWGLWLIAGGGLGNLYDRMVYGYVVDFLETAFIRFPVFNIADVCICAGAGLAILGLLLDEIRAKAQKGNENAE